MRFEQVITGSHTEKHHAHTQTHTLTHKITHISRTHHVLIYISLYSNYFSPSQIVSEPSMQRSLQDKANTQAISSVRPPQWSLPDQLQQKQPQPPLSQPQHSQPHPHPHPQHWRRWKASCGRTSHPPWFVFLFLPSRFGLGFTSSQNAIPNISLLTERSSQSTRALLAILRLRIHLWVSRGHQQSPDGARRARRVSHPRGVRNALLICGDDQHFQRRNSNLSP